MSSTSGAFARHCLTWCCQVKANGPPKIVEPASSGGQLAPLGQGGGTVLSEDVAAVEVAVLVEMIED